jgi:hypothetical protein
MNNENKCHINGFLDKQRRQEKLGGCVVSVSDPDSICLLDPDPAADKISFKSQKKSYYLNLFDKFEHFFKS